MTDEQRKPTPEERASKFYHEYMASKKSDVPLSLVKEHVVRKVADEINSGKARDDAKDRAAKAFDVIDSNERRNANAQMRTGQASFDVGEHDLIVALAGTDEVEDEDDQGNPLIDDEGKPVTHLAYSGKDTARCRIGVISMDEYLRWDFLQDANRRAANEAYDKGKARFALYLPYFQQGLTVEQIDKRGLLRRNGGSS